MPGLPPAGLGYGRSDDKPLQFATLSGLRCVPVFQLESCSSGSLCHALRCVPVFQLESCSSGSLLQSWRLASRLIFLFHGTNFRPFGGRFVSSVLTRWVLRQVSQFFGIFRCSFWLSVMLQVRNLLRGCAHRRCLLVVYVASLRRRACDETTRLHLWHRLP